MALDVEAPDAHAIDVGLGVGPGLPEREHVDLATRRRHRLRLASDARILLVIGVREHGDGPAT